MVPDYFSGLSIKTKSINSFYPVVIITVMGTSSGRQSSHPSSLRPWPPGVSSYGYCGWRLLRVAPSFPSRSPLQSPLRELASGAPWLCDLLLKRVLRIRYCSGLVLECCPLAGPAFTSPTSQRAFYPSLAKSNIQYSYPKVNFSGWFVFTRNEHTLLTNC